MIRTGQACLAAVALTLVTGPVRAAPIHGYDGLAMSARGDQLATIESGGSVSPRGAVTIRASNDGHLLRRLDPCLDCQYSGLRYGPNGSLAFLARDTALGRVTLYVATGAKLAVIATIPGLAENPRFSPDGRRIALLVTLGSTKETGATQPGARQVGEIGSHPDSKRLAIFDLAAPQPTGAITPLSPADRYIYEYDWAPDGRSLVVTSAPGDGDANWWVATLDALDVATGTLRPITAPATQLRFPQVSPDGKSVAYIGGLMSDYGSIGGDVWRVPIGGGQPENLTAGERVTYTSLTWTRAGLRAATLQGDSMGAAAIAATGGGTGLFAMPVSLAAGEGRIAWAADGKSLATVVQDFTHAPAIYAGRPSRPRKLTHDNDAAPAVIAARSVTWRNEGFEAQGWLLSPTRKLPGKAPLIVAVHGGPSAASSPRYYEHGASTYLLDAGYYVFQPNPRGSFGQGEAFTAANKRDFGGGDLRDILAGIDAVERIAPIDDQRLGLQGCSYGGFMAIWANTRTSRFKAIVAGAGIANWVSYYGTNGINQWMLPFFGASAYDDAKAYENVSAVYAAKAARTPTFIYVGERDIEVPPTQSVEWWRALTDHGVPASLVIYPEAGHCVTAPDQASDVRSRALAWFDRYLGRQ